MRITEIIIVVLITLVYYTSGMTLKINEHVFAKTTNDVFFTQIKDNKTVVIDDTNMLKVVEFKGETK